MDEGELWDDELRFLVHYGIAAEDVFDARGMSKKYREVAAKRDGKEIILAAPCGNGGHRLKTRSGHCAQCRPERLGFQRHYDNSRFVYIAGSLSGKLIKVGRCLDIQQRLKQIQSEQYGGFHDWKLLRYLEIPNAGAVETLVGAALSNRAVPSAYFKDGLEQLGQELFQCSFSLAWHTLLGVADSKEYYTIWTTNVPTELYEFE